MISTTENREQIYCVFQSDENIKIFDQDSWEPQTLNSQRQIPMSKQNPYLNQKEKANFKVIGRIQQQLADSKHNFYKVKISKVKNQSKLANLQSGNSKVQQKQNIKISSLKAIPNKQQKQIKHKISNSKSLKKISLDLSKKNTVLKQGYLNKKTDGFFFKWHKRFVVITPQKLYCFEDERKQKVVSCVNLKLMGAKVRLQKNEQSQNCMILDFLGQCENLIFQSTQESKAQNIEQWNRIVEQVIQFQSNSNKIFLKTALKPLYEFKDTLTQKQLVEYAETGDILLFYTQNSGAKLQRFLTNSQYDHVAMIIKLKSKQIMVFQSNSLYGVSVYEWKQYIQYFDLYEKVTIRKLNYLKKSDLHHCFLSFARRNMGRKYQISAGKLLKFQSDVDWKDINAQIEAQQSRGYFCSELIAKAFKSAGLLEQRKSSAKYWPVDFSQKQKLNEQLKRGAQLGPQQVIILDKHQKH